MSNTSKSTARSRYWREQVERWRVSGQTQRAFCLGNDLNYPCFGYWRRKFLPKSPSPGPRRRQSAFVPVLHEGSSAPSALSMTLPNGVVLRGIAPENVAVVCQLLAELP